MTDRPASAQDFKPDEDSTLDNYVDFSKGSGLFDAFANVVKNISEGDGGEIVAHGLGLGLGIAVILEAIILAATIFLIPLAIAKTVSTVVTTASKVTNLLNKLLAYAQKMAKELGTLKKMAMDYLRGIWEPAAANTATGVAGMKTDNL